MHVLMVRPDAFDVTYEINAWMHADTPVNHSKAAQQWHTLKNAYLKLGVTVTEKPADPALPDAVFSADGSLSIGSKTALATFTHAERAPEAAHHLSWATARGQHILIPTAHFEGGDALRWRNILLMGHGFRTQLAAGRELAHFFNVDVITLHLTDPCFYHLDTALTVLGPDLLAYYPSAFTPAGRAKLQALPVTLLEATKKDALAFGLNSVRVGGTVLISPGATQLHQKIAARGLQVLPLDTSEFQKSGGGIKCLSNILYPASAA